MHGRLKLLSGLIVAVAAGTAAQAAEFITNGDFSSASYATNSQFGGGFGGQGVTDWTGLGGNHLQFWYGFGHGVGGAPTTALDNAVNQFGDPRAYFHPSMTTLSEDGGAFVALDGAAGVQGQISQTVNGLTAGHDYTLTFDWAAGQLANRKGATTEQLQVTFGADTVATSVVSVASEGFSGWMTQSYKFTAASGSQLLTFLSVGTPRGLPPIALLDGVSLTDVGVGGHGGGIPEPASWALMILGFGGIGAVVRARRRGAAIPG